MASVIGAALLWSIPVIQSRHMQTEELKLVGSLHEEAIAQERQQHRSALEHEAALYKEENAQEIALHHRSMRLRVDLERRETFRDVWQQRNLVNQTVLITNTLMFSCAFTTLSQSTIPKTTAEWLLYSFSVMCGAGIAILLVSIWCCFKMQARLGGYNAGDPTIVYSCGHRHEHFNSFYDCHCSLVHRLSIGLFYAGTSCVLFAAAALQSAKYLETFDDPGPAVVFTVLVVGSVVVVAVGSLFEQGRPHQGVSDYGGLGAATTHPTHESSGVAIRVPSAATGATTAAAPGDAAPRGHATRDTSATMAAAAAAAATPLEGGAEGIFRGGSLRSRRRPPTAALTSDDAVSETMTASPATDGAGGAPVFRDRRVAREVSAVFDVAGAAAVAALSLGDDQQPNGVEGVESLSDEAEERGERFLAASASRRPTVNPSNSVFGAGDAGLNDGAEASPQDVVERELSLVQRETSEPFFHSPTTNGPLD